MKPFQAIAAMAENRVIGQGNQIPWHLPEDFRWFKQKTMGQVLVMGRLTYQSIGRALPGRQTLIMSRSGFEAEGLLTLDSVDALLAWSKDQERTLFICGGALLYAQLLEHCSDCFFPASKASLRAMPSSRPLSTCLTQVKSCWKHLSFRLPTIGPLSLELKP